MDRRVQERQIVREELHFVTEGTRESQHYKVIKQIMEKIWNWLNGKKTTISVFLLIMLKGINALFPDLLEPEISSWIEDLLLFIAGGSAGHRIIKQYQTKQLKQNGTRDFHKRTRKEAESALG